MKDLQELASKVGVDLRKKKISLSSLERGVKDETREHGTPGKFDVIKGNKLSAVKIALSHLVKDPNYYN